MKRTTRLQRFRVGCWMSALGAIGLVCGPAHSESAPGYHIVERIAVADGWWDYATFDPRQRQLLVSREDGVLLLNVDTGAQKHQAMNARGGRATVLLPNGGTALTTAAESKRAVIWNTSTGEVRATVALKEEPDAAVYDPVSQVVWIMEEKGIAALVDPAAGKVVGELKIGGELEFAVVDGSGTLYVNVADDAQVAVIDTRARRVSGHYKLAGCKRPTGLAYLPSQEQLLAVCANGLAKLLAARTGHEVASLPIGKSPDAVIYDAKGAQALIPSGASGTLSVLSLRGATSSVLETVKTQFGTRTGALDPETHRLYLPTARFAASGAESSSPPLPGSVQILVLAPGAVQQR